MQLPPAKVLHTWPEANYIDPPTRGHGAIIVNIVCTVLAIIVTCLRVYSRMKITFTAGLDDLFILLGLGFTIAMCVVTSIASEAYGWSRHMWDVPLEWLPTLSKLNLTFQMLFSVAATFTKLSLLWFCRRLLGAGSKGMRLYNRILVVAMYFVALSSLLFLCLSMFQCRPIKAYWDLLPEYPHHCLDDGWIVFSASLINIFTDVAITIIPMPLIWHLKLPIRQRLAVISIFGLGVVVDVAGSVRTVYVWKSMIASWDTTWQGWPVLPAAAVEINMGLICASAPALRPLIASFLPRVLGSSFASTNRRSHTVKSRPSINHSRTGSHQNGHQHQHQHQQEQPPEIPQNRFQVLRTVEMKTWSEIRTSQDQVGNIMCDVSADNKVITPTRTAAYELNNESGVLYIPSSGNRSMESLTDGASTDRHDDLV